MDWSQVITILAANFGLFLWATRQARTDYLNADRKIEENRKENNNLLKEIQQEMKNFHDRLFLIEQNGKK